MIGYSFVKSGIVLSLLIGASAAPATAEVIAVKKGTFVVEGGEGRLNLFGTRDFRLNAVVSLHGGFFPAFAECELPEECPPGRTLDLTANWSGGDIFGSAELRGVTYASIGGPSDDASASVGFSGSVTLPSTITGPATISVPFDFAGHFSYGLNGPDPKSDLLTGGGRATLTLVPHPENPQNWMIQKVVFEFRPVETRR